MEIGSLVRVECNGQFRRGMIACINTPSSGSSDDVTYDVIYKNNEEENNISITRIQPLLDLLPLPSPHSLSHDESNDIHHLEYLESLKSCGNNLFKSKDYEGAYEYYLQAHHYIQKLQLLTIGKRVLIAIKSYQKSGSIMNYEIGTITDITTTTTTGSSSSRGNENKNGNEDNNHILTVDVMYDTYLTPDDNNDEEINIQISRIIPLYELKNENQLLAIELQRSIWMNLSKCATKRNLKGWAVHWALLAVGLVKGIVFLLLVVPPLTLSSRGIVTLSRGTEG